MIVLDDRPRAGLLAAGLAAGLVLAAFAPSALAQATDPSLPVLTPWPEQPPPPPPPPGPGLVFSDRADWSDWTIRFRGQAWVEGDRKVFAFDPANNQGFVELGTGPTIRKIRVTLDLYFPSGWSFNDPGPGSHLLGLSSYNTLVERPPGGWTRFDIDMNGSRNWRIIAGWVDDNGVQWDSGGRYTLGDVFNPGWNSVEWTVILRGRDENNDDMTFRVGSFERTWRGEDMSRSNVGIGAFYLGNFDNPIGPDRYIAIRNLRVYVVD